MYIQRHIPHFGRSLPRHRLASVTVSGPPEISSKIERGVLMCATVYIYVYVCMHA